MARTIRVKAKEGRIARESPRGDFIPHDRFVRVDHTNYVKRLIEVHEDVIVEADPVKVVPKTAPKTAPVAETPPAANKEG